MTKPATPAPKRTRRPGKGAPVRSITRSNGVAARRLDVAGKSPRDTQLTRDEVLAVVAALAATEADIREAPRGRGRPRRPETLAAARLMVLVASYIGARVGELCDLRASDVDTVEDAPGLTRVWLERSKGSRPGYVFVGNATGAQLLDLATTVAAERGEDAVLFATSTGAPIDQADLSRTIRAALARAGVELAGRQTWHALRHHAAWREWNRSQNLRHVQALLGHTTPETTAEYLKLAAAEREEMALAAVAGLDYDEGTVAP